MLMDALIWALLALNSLIVRVIARWQDRGL